METPIPDIKDKAWKQKIENSIKNILALYDLDEADIKVYRAKLAPRDIWVAAADECKLATAKELAANKYPKLPPPITVVQYKNKNVIFIGSNRSLVFLLKKELPDCIIVKLPDDMEEPKLIKEAKSTLLDIFEG